MERFCYLILQFLSKFLLNRYFQYKIYALKRNFSLKSQKINLGGYFIHYLDSQKDKPTIIFLYGLLDSMISFKKLIPYLKEDFRIILVDIPGYGKNQLPKVRYLYQIDVFSDILYEWIENLKIEDIILCGHSIGGLVAQKIALKDKQKHISKLILIASANSSHKKRDEMRKIFPPTTHFYVEELFQKLFYQKKIKIPRILSWVLIHFWNSWENDFLAFNTLKEEEKAFHSIKVAKIQIPVLLLAGKYDQITPLDMIQKMNEQIQNSKLVVFDKSHALHIQDAEKISAEIRDFILRNL